MSEAATGAAFRCAECEREIDTLGHFAGWRAFRTEEPLGGPPELVVLCDDCVNREQLD